MIPMCWKCSSTIVTEHGSSFIFIGCKEEDRINTYEDAKRLCPLIQENNDD